MNNNTIKSIFYIALSSIIGYLFTLFLTSFVSENLGIEAYGYICIGKTFANYGNIATIALTSFIVRYISYHYHRNEFKEAHSYYVSSINACLVMCVILSLLFIILIVNLDSLIIIPNSIIESVKILFIYIFIAFLVTTLSTPFSVGYYIKNRLDIIGKVKILSYFSEIVVLVLLFRIFDPSLWFVGIGTCIASITVLLVNILINNKILPEFCYNNVFHSNNKIKVLLGNGLWNSINQLGNTLNSGLDLLVSNTMLTSIQTGEIAVAKSIGAIFSAFSGIVFQPFQPELLRTYSEGVKSAFLEQLNKSIKFCGFFASLTFAGFLGIGEAFYMLWLPNENTKLLYELTLITVFTFIMDIFLQPIYYVSTLTVKNKLPCFITILGGVMNVTGMYILIKYTSLQAYSIPLTTAIIMFFINFVFNPIYASRCLKINSTYFYPLVLKHLLATTVLCILAIGVNKLFFPLSLVKFILAIIIITLLGSIFYSAIVFDTHERKRCLVYVYQIIGFITNIAKN